MLVFSISLCCNAQNSPQDYLDAHNAARAAVGVGPMTWDASAAAYAQNYANIRSADCSLTHSGSFRFGFGENLAAGGGPLTGNEELAEVSQTVIEPSLPIIPTSGCEEFNFQEENVQAGTGSPPMPATFTEPMGVDYPNNIDQPSSDPPIVQPASDDTESINADTAASAVIGLRLDELYPPNSNCICSGESGTLLSLPLASLQTIMNPVLLVTAAFTMTGTELRPTQMMMSAIA
nr:pathogenesis-related protein 1A-like [Ipomoea batatas]